jgi:hypothetical protein
MPREPLQEIPAPDAAPIPLQPPVSVNQATAAPAEVKPLPTLKRELAVEPPKQSGEGAKVSSKKIDSAPVKPAASAKIAGFDQLPVTIRQEMTAPILTLHFFTSHPPSRLVRINNQNLREGQSLADGLKVEEITADGAILSVRGEKFRIGGR